LSCGDQNRNAWPSPVPAPRTAIGPCATGGPPPSGANCDVALYSAPLTGNYTVTANADGSVTVADNAFVAAADLFAKGDGVDTLWNVEAIGFCDANDAVTKNCTHYDIHSISEFGTATPPPAATAPATPTITTVIPGAGSATVAFTLGADGGAPITSVSVSVRSTSLIASWMYSVES